MADGGICEPLSCEPNPWRARNPRLAFCDDAERCPGHKDWRPHEPRRALLRNTCPGLGVWILLKTCAMYIQARCDAG